MTGNGIPAGLGVDDVMRHNFIVGTAARLINAGSDYLESPDDTAAEIATQDQLAALLAQFESETPRDADMALVLVLVSLICATVEEADAQAWFDDQAEKIRRALA